MTTAVDYKNYLDNFENHYGYDISYLRVMLESHPEAFAAFSEFMPLSEFRQTLPVEPFFVAKLAAIKVADCGPCVELCLKMAVEAGVSKRQLKHVLEGTAEESMMRVYSFAETVARHETVDPVDLEWLRVKYGVQGMLEMALVVATTGVYPLIKRAMGMATHCSAVHLQALN